MLAVLPFELTGSFLLALEVRAKCRDLNAGLASHGLDTALSQRFFAVRASAPGASVGICPTALADWA